jgi:hypothetical protein
MALLPEPMVTAAECRLGAGPASVSKASTIAGSRRLTVICPIPGWRRFAREALKQLIYRAERGAAISVWPQFVLPQVENESNG